jgi:hypothetical protein
MSACLYSGPLTVIRGPDEAITRCVHSASRRSWCPWFPYYVSTRISGCSPPFVYSMNVSGNSRLSWVDRGFPLTSQKSRWASVNTLRSSITIR